MTALIDTCVVVDFLQSREPFAESAKKIMQAAAVELFTGYITAKSASDIYYLTRKCTHNDKESRLKLSKLLTIVNMLDSAAEDVFNAIPSEMKDFEDAVMVETAARSKIDCIVTRNEKDFQKSKIKIYSPLEFVEMLEKEQRLLNY
ncbi:MAG: PIN domain-containing protein [Ruminococcus sp.]|nr:PIN domain-containing protein [Ruminococcus sp.]MCM1380878.1 PIN domain-containing protein [Muribaculaceae bacterium]MCM1479619.1 PIN domain-containing protein [Muribaculaceae bacterium]